MGNLFRVGHELRELGQVQDVHPKLKSSSEAVYSEEVSPFKHFYQVEKISAPTFGYVLDRYGFDVGMLVVIGTVYRVIAFLLMILLNRRKQK